MYFELNKQTYQIKFYREGTTTSAELFEVSKTPEGENAIMHTGIAGIASLHFSDRFVKKVGRVVALTKLLEILSDHDTDYGRVLSREDRKTIWEAYFKTHKK